ncbi:MAG: hypothetical protein NEHIOOID_00690 [Holosporales bacterium]
MEFHFPIANVVYDPFLIGLLGLVVGFLSGFFGLGTGILATPLLLLLGFPSRITVASQLNVSIGANLSGFFNYSQKKDVDYALGAYLILGGLMGALTEFFVLRWLYHNVSPTGVLRAISGVVLIILSLAMFYQTIKSFLSDHGNTRSVTMKRWMIYIPFHRVFARSRTEISILVPLSVGYLTGILTISLGGGVNVMMMPFLTYLIGRVSPCIAGTNFFVSFIITLTITAIHSLGTAPVDMILVVIMTITCSIGSKFGAKVVHYFPGQIVNLVGASIVLFLGGKTLSDVISLKHKKQKIILDNGVRHYLNDLTQSSDQCMGKFSKSVLLFANNDPVLYTACCIFLSIFIAFICDRAIEKFLFTKK